MSSHQQILLLSHPLDVCLNACKRAGEQMGMQVTQASDHELICREVRKHAISFTNPVTIALSFRLRHGQTSIAAIGENLGLGPLQDRHVEKQVHMLLEGIRILAPKSTDQQARIPKEVPEVQINCKLLTEGELQILQDHEVQVQSGNYWYDHKTGAWGYLGGPMNGLLPAGLNIGGPMPAHASGGQTGVFINGRELHARDVQVLRTVTTAVLPGRWWMDELGNIGYEGGPLIGNIWAMAGNGSRRDGVPGGILSQVDKTGLWLS